MLDGFQLGQHVTEQSQRCLELSLRHWIRRSVHHMVLQPVDEIRRPDSRAQPFAEIGVDCFEGFGIAHGRISQTSPAFGHENTRK